MPKLSPDQIEQIWELRKKRKSYQAIADELEIGSARTVTRYAKMTAAQKRTEREKWEKGQSPPAPQSTAPDESDDPIDTQDQLSADPSEVEDDGEGVDVPDAPKKVPTAAQEARKRFEQIAVEEANESVVVINSIGRFVADEVMPITEVLGVDTCTYILEAVLYRIAVEESIDDLYDENAKLRAALLEYQEFYSPLKQMVQSRTELRHIITLMARNGQPVPQCIMDTYLSFLQAPPVEGIE